MSKDSNNIINDHGIIDYNDSSSDDEMIPIIVDKMNPTNDQEESVEEIWRQLSTLPPVRPIHLSFFKKITIASGHILNDLCASLWFSYLLLYFQKVVEFDHTSSSYDSQYAAALMFLGQIVDGLATPLIGYEADRETDCCLCRASYGRCKSWHLVGSICVALSFPFIFSPCIGCTNGSTTDWAKLIYYAPFIAIFQMGWAASQISHLALIPKMHPDELVRTELFSMRYAFTVGSNVIIFLMTWFTLGNNNNCQITPDDASDFMKVAFIAVGIGITFTLIFHIVVREEADEKVKRNVSVINSRKELIRRLSISSHSHSIHSHSNNQTTTNTNNIGDLFVPIPTNSSKSKSLTPRDEDEDLLNGNGDSETDESTLLLVDDNNASDGNNRSQINSKPPPEIRNRTSHHNRTISFQDDDDGIGIIQPGNGNDHPNNSNSAGNDFNANDDEDRNDTLRTSRFSTRNLNIGKEKMTMRDWLSLPQFYIVALIYMATRQSVNLSQVYMPLYLQDSLLLPCRTIATIPLTMYISGFISSLFIKILNKHLGRQLAYFFGATLCIIGALLILFLHWDTEEFLREYIIYGVAVLLGGGASAILVTSLSITADMIGNNVENGAFVYGAMSFCDKVSCGLTVLLISTLVPCGDEDNRNNLSDDDPCKQLKNNNVAFYRHVLGFSAGGCALIGVIGIIMLTFQIHFQSLNQKRAATAARERLLQ